MRAGKKAVGFRANLKARARRPRDNRRDAGAAWGRRPRHSVHENVALELRPGLDSVAGEVGHAGGGQHFVVNEKIASGGSAVAGEDVPGGVGNDFWRAPALRFSAG